MRRLVTVLHFTLTACAGVLALGLVLTAAVLSGCARPCRRG